MLCVVPVVASASGCALLYDFSDDDGAGGATTRGQGTSATGSTATNSAGPTASADTATATGASTSTGSGGPTPALGVSFGGALDDEAIEPGLDVKTDGSPMLGLVFRGTIDIGNQFVGAQDFSLAALHLDGVLEPVRSSHILDSDHSFQGTWPRKAGALALPSGASLFYGTMAGLLYPNGVATDVTGQSAWAMRYDGNGLTTGAFHTSGNVAVGAAAIRVQDTIYLGFNGTTGTITGNQLGGGTSCTGPVVGGANVMVLEGPTLTCSTIGRVHAIDEDKLFDLEVLGNDGFSASVINFEAGNDPPNARVLFFDGSRVMQNQVQMGGRVTLAPAKTAVQFYCETSFPEADGLGPELRFGKLQTDDPEVTPELLGSWQSGGIRCTDIIPIVNDFLIVGDYLGAGFHPDVALSSERDGFVMRVDRMGNVVWARSFGGAGTQTATGVAHRAGQTFVTGTTAGAFDFGASHIEHRGGTDAFVLRFDEVP